MSWRRLAPIFLLCLVLGGCARAALYTQLTERDANEMLAVLQSGGVSAEKLTKDGKSWSIDAPKSDFARAVLILRDQGYPKDHYDNLGDVFKKQGFVSSPLEEHARLLFGLSQELERTIS